MSSPRKINSARANGAKSRGPKTESGRKASSMNAVTHGLYSKSVVLQQESPQQHREMLDAYIQQFQPQGQAEFDLLEEMVAAKWRQRRLWAIESDLLEEEIHKQKDKFEEGDQPLDDIVPLSFAYRELAGGTSLPFLNRNESRLERAYSRALKTLLELQRLRQAAPTVANQNLQKRTQIPIPVKQLNTRHPPATTHQQQPAITHGHPNKAFPLGADG
jgi:hypothetical protein